MYIGLRQEFSEGRPRLIRLGFGVDDWLRIRLLRTSLRTLPSYVISRISKYLVIRISLPVSNLLLSLPSLYARAFFCYHQVMLLD